MFGPGLSVLRCGKNESGYCYGNVECSGNDGTGVGTYPQPSHWSEDIEVHDKERVFEEKIDDGREAIPNPQRLREIALSAMSLLITEI